MLASARDIASALRIFGSKTDAPLELWEKLKEAPAYIAQWKLSSARHGARMAFALVKGNYREVDVRHCSKGMPAKNNRDELNDSIALWNSMAGFDNSVANLCTLDELLDAEEVPPRAEGEEASTDDDEEDEDEANSRPEDDEDPKSPAA